MTIVNILKRAKKKTTPTKKEQQEMKQFVKKLLAASLHQEYSPMVCGSIGKNTWLSGRREVDLFMLYFPSLDKEHLEKKGLKNAKRIVSKLKGKYKLAYSEHPYLQSTFRFKKKEFEVDLVPAFDVPDPSIIRSSVDRTPHHVRYILNNMSEKMKDDVRLLKQFCIAHECYGADLKVLGFSGYLCELLIQGYGSFLKCMQKAAKWKPGTKLWIEDEGRDFETPLVFIDPVDPNRNVAAVVSVEKFYEFIEACRNFIKKPNIKHFFPPKLKPLSITKVKTIMKKRGTSFLLLKFRKPKALDDILWAQLRKAQRIISRYLRTAGFMTIRSGAWMDNKTCVIMIELENSEVPRIRKKIGPYITAIKPSSDFLEHYAGNVHYIENGRWVAEVYEKYTDVLKFLKNMLSLPGKDLHYRGIPSKLAPNMSKCKIELSPQKIKMISSLPKDFKIFLRKYFLKNKFTF